MGPPLDVTALSPRHLFLQLPKAALGTAFPLARTSTRPVKETNTSQEGNGISRLERHATCLPLSFSKRGHIQGQTKSMSVAGQLVNRGLLTTFYVGLPTRATPHLIQALLTGSKVIWECSWTPNKSRAQEMTSAMFVKGFLCGRLSVTCTGSLSGPSQQAWKLLALLQIK